MKIRKKETQQLPETNAVADIKEKWLKRAERIVIGLIVAWLSYSNVAGPSYTNIDNNTPKNGKTEAAKINNQPAPHIITTGNSEKGKFICGDNSNEPDQEIIPVPVNIKEKGYITINANAEGKFEPSLKKGDLGKVIVKICIDQIEYRKDVSAFQNCKNKHITMPLAASVTFGKVLEPGEYLVTVIGIFEGCVVNPHTAVDFKVERLPGTQPGSIKISGPK